MALIPTPKNWINPALEEQIKNYKKTRNDTYVRQGNSAISVEQIINTLNHLAGTQARQLYSQGFDPEDVLTQDNADPQLTWLYDDYNINGRGYTMHLVSLKYNDDDYDVVDGYNYTADAYSSAYTDYELDSSITGNVSDTSSLSLWSDITYRKIRVSRGTPTDSKVDDGITTQGGLLIADINVQEDPINLLDSYDAYRCIDFKPTPVNPINYQDMDYLRRTVHQLRTTCLPIIFSWSALAAGENCTTDDYGDANGICVNNTTYANVFDQTITARTADSIGAMYDGYRCGIGKSGNLKCACRVLARNTLDGYDGYVKFLGPSGISNNETEILIDDTDYAWYGDEDGYLFLDSDVLFSDETTGRNKIDIHSKINDNNNKLQIAAISIFGKI